MKELTGQVRAKYPDKDLSVGLTYAMVPNEAEQLDAALKEELSLKDDVILGLIGPTIEFMWVWAQWC